MYGGTEEPRKKPRHILVEHANCRQKGLSWNRLRPFLLRGNGANSYSPTMQTVQQYVTINTRAIFVQFPL